ncbi:hypothetical protein [Haloarcula litorea]|uniref:hypothetical protein n=1 Tax=Haloarcula litorea TaxID=3032579 RepID=UPI0023E85773|nr:hypothetical protein [Halomicroarcula sp. GDY20]
MENGSQSAAAVSGRAVRAIVDGVVRTCGCFEDRTRSLLARNGLADPSEDEWYAVADYRAVYDDLLATTGHNIVERIGVTLARTVDWPADVDGVGDALAGLDGLHRSLHRGDAGGYEFTATGPLAGRLRCSTPYPPAFERGVVRGIGQRFGADSGFVAVREADRRDDDVTLSVRWWAERGSRESFEGSAAGTDGRTFTVAGD